MAVEFDPIELPGAKLGYPRAMSAHRTMLALIAVAACGGGNPDSTESSGTQTTSTADASTDLSTGSSSATTGPSMSCADAVTPETCEATASESVETQCVWVELYDVSTADGMCTAEPTNAACFEVITNDGGCGACHYRAVGTDAFEVAVLSKPLNCNQFMTGVFVSCDADPDMPVFACTCACR